MIKQKKKRNAFLKISDRIQNFFKEKYWENTKEKKFLKVSGESSTQNKMSNL